MATPDLMDSAISPSQGLTSAEASELLQRFGPNTIQETPEKIWLMLLKRFWGVIPWMLEAAIIIDLILERWVEAVLIAVLLISNAYLGFAQENRAKQAVALLRQRLAIYARVRRDGKYIFSPIGKARNLGDGGAGCPPGKAGRAHPGAAGGLAGRVRAAAETRRRGDTVKKSPCHRVTGSSFTVHCSPFSVCASLLEQALLLSM